MKRYARVKNGMVVETFRTSMEIGHLFHSDLKWVDVGDHQVAVGWLYNGVGFTPPKEPPPPKANPESASRGSELQVEIALLGKRIAELSSRVAALPTA